MYLRNYFEKIILENHCNNFFFYKKQNKIVIIKNNIAIRIAGNVSRHIDASMNRATPSGVCRVSLFVSL